MLAINSLSKRFATGLLALDRIDLTVAEGEIVGLVGASGCGKSTLLRILSGLEPPSSGTASIDGDPVRGPRSEIGVVFQEPRLMPWLTVAENVRFGIAQLPRAEQEARSRAVLAKVGLGRFADALPRELSGGMAQRVAIARALVRQPSILLLDEPFSALDSFTRLALQEHLLRLWQEARFTMLFVTHDIEEAIALADRVLVMRGHPGRIHREIPISLVRPRKRTAAYFQALKEKVLEALDLDLKSERDVAA